MVSHLIHAAVVAQATEAEPPADRPSQVAAPATPELGEQIKSVLGPTFDQTTLTGWTILLAGIFGGLVAGKIAQTIFKNTSERLRKRGWKVRGSILQHAANPISLAFFAIGLQFGLRAIYLEKDSALEKLPGKTVGLLLVVALAWFLYNLVDLLEVGMRRITNDDTIILLIRKTLRIFLLIVFALFIAQNTFEANISAWLAGLGLAGLAVSLAAQGPIKNLFGSVTVVLDRPFGLGDRIKFGNYTGVVETMGFRSTKLRTLEGHLVTIPNMKIIDDVVENITARPSIRRQMNITITYDTPPEKVEQALRIIRGLLAEPFMAETFNMTDAPPRVAFNEFNADSLNIAVNYWYQLNVEGRDWWTFQAQSQEFNLRLMRAFNEAGIDFAFPTRTLYLAGDQHRELALRVLQSNGETLQSPERVGPI
jgi:MscS family membrane protein